MEVYMKTIILDLFNVVFFLDVLLVPILLGMFLSLLVGFGLMRARQIFFRLLKIGSFLTLGWFGVVLLGIVLHMLLV
jgi:hypothetical protein